MKIQKQDKSTPDIEYAIQTLRKYAYSKEELMQRIRSERLFWSEKYKGGHQNSTTWLHNSVLNKHADMTDNMPACICLPREERDVDAARMLTKIIPVINSRCRFDEIYSDNAWNKIRYGTAIYGVFWKSNLYDGLGDIDICKINIDNIFWEMGVEDIEDSKNLFICALEDIEALKELYPDIDFDCKASGDITSYIFGDALLNDEKCAVVDWYYKKQVGDREVLHLCKFCEYGIIYASELDEGCVDGWYSHGKYPVVIDAMYPCDGEAYGFGVISVGRGCEEYISKLDKNIENYSNLASNVRFWAKKSLGINLNDFEDKSRSIVEVEGDIDEEKLKRIDVGTMDKTVVDVVKMKIDELKEITGCREVSVGRTSGNVSAASAISMLQNADAKFSRDGIEGSRRACVKIWELTLELIRQFYTEERVFRITGEDGDCYEYFNADSIRATNEGYCPCFDIRIDTRKRSYNERCEINNLAMELYKLGAFKKENIEQTRLLLELIDIDGIGKLKCAMYSKDFSPV